MLNDNVLRFDIAMYNSIAMYIRNSFINIAEYVQNLILIEFFPFLDKFVQMVARTVLHHEVDVGLVVEETVQLNDIRVV
jgi:hypothetical protein